MIIKRVLFRSSLSLPEIQLSGNIFSFGTFHLLVESACEVCKDQNLGSSAMACTVHRPCFLSSLHVDAIAIVVFVEKNHNDKLKDYQRRF